MDLSVEAYLNSFLNWEPRLDTAGVSSFTLDHVEKLLGAFGRPDDQLKFVHVAGSKGKGSTCVFLAHILRAAGYRVGLYTSPHLHDLRERIRILEPEASKFNGLSSQDESFRQLPSAGDFFEGMISAEDLADRVRFYQAPVDRLRQVDGVEITYFEYLTALALSYFAARQVQVVVLETGLGGRLDATNAVDTLVCGITPIGLEHTRILGDTLSRIAGEKAGIIKSPFQKVTIAQQPGEAMEVIRARCGEFGIVPTVIGKELGLSIRSQDLRGVTFDVTGRRAYRGLSTRLIGAHQAVNAATAISMAEDLEVFGFLLTDEVVARGVRETVWPVRFEIVGREPSCILDCAHTRESAGAFTQTFRALFPDRRAVLVFGASRDKDLDALAGELAPIAGRVVLARADNPRACDLSVADGERLFPGVPVDKAEGVRAALELASREAEENGIMAVVGSIFLCAEARKILLEISHSG